MWSFVSSVLLDLTGCQVNISVNAILFNIFKPHIVSHYNDLLMLLINVVKFCIWTLRNQAKLEFLKVTHICIKTMFLRTLRLRIKTYFTRFSSSTFGKYWCRNNRIAYVEGDLYIYLCDYNHPELSSRKYICPVCKYSGTVQSCKSSFLFPSL